MQAARFLMVAVVSTVCAAMAWRSDDTPRPNESARIAHTARERIRLQAHFDSVDLELRAATPATMPAAQRTRRAQLIGWLREYRDAGIFPENDRFAAPTPFFVDHRGVRCAMGELLHRAGRDDIVRDVKSARNNAYIAQLADDPRLIAWLDSVGFTVAEAARVQPSYDGIGGGDIIDDVGRPTTARDRTVAAALGGASLAMLGVNLRRSNGWSQWAGLAAGTATVLTGRHVLTADKRNNDGLVTASVVTGVASFGMAAFRVFHPSRPKPDVTVAGRVGTVSLQPALVPSGAGRLRAGVGLHATFR